MTTDNDDAIGTHFGGPPMEATHTEDTLHALRASPVEAVRLLAARLLSLANLDEITPHDVAMILAEQLTLVDWLARRAFHPQAGAAAGMGSRLVDRAMGPETTELVDVLAATEHALEIERGRVERIARAALSLLDELAQRGGPAHPELRALLEPLVDRQAAQSDDEPQSEATT